MQIMLTRPRTDSEQLAKILRERGDNIIVEPMLEIVPVAESIALDGISALIATSANGVNSFANISSQRKMPMFVVGDGTAAAAHASGFERVENAQGEAADLVRLIKSAWHPNDGALLHVCGRNVGKNLVRPLGNDGYTVHSAVVYVANVAQNFSKKAHDLILSQNIDAIFFYSPRTANTFAKIIFEENLSENCGTTTALCLSSAVAAAISNLTWRDIWIATAPDGGSMLQLRDSLQECRNK